MNGNEVDMKVVADLKHLYRVVGMTYFQKENDRTDV